MWLQRRQAHGPWWPQLSRLSGWWVAVSLPALLASVATPPLCCSPAFSEQTKTVNVPFQPRSAALLSTNQLVPCCRCAAPWCSWMYPGQAEGVWDSDAGPGTKLQWNWWLDDKAVYEKENKNNQWRERRGGLKRKVIMEKEGGAWKKKYRATLDCKTSPCCWGSSLETTKKPSNRHQRDKTLHLQGTVWWPWLNAPPQSSCWGKLR